MKENKVFSANSFNSLLIPEKLTFDPIGYSRLKFGSKLWAERFGLELANKFYEKHHDILISEQLIIIPSPYNYVKNAATLMAEYFYNRLNHLVVGKTGRPIEFVTIQRKVSYTQDYGFLSKEKRKGLLDNDQFYLNREYMKNKTIIFLDDVKITGTHEDKLLEIIKKKKLDNIGHFFIYYAEYLGGNAEIESELNFSDNLLSYTSLAGDLSNGNNELIIRPMKYLLSLTEKEFSHFLTLIHPNVIEKFYYNAISEGYHAIPKYQENFINLKAALPLEFL